MRAFAATILTTLSLAAATSAAPRVPYLPVPAGAAVILDSGSTNTAGYRIVVARSGDAEYVAGSARATGAIPISLAARFFTDLSHAMPLAGLPVERCMKSVSFGTSLYVWWHGSRSPDVSCSGDAGETALASDAASIAAALHVSTPPGRLVRPLPNEPRKPLPTPQTAG
jgi:hypothetical protein